MISTDLESLQKSYQELLDAMTWLAGKDTGVSSVTICLIMFGIENESPIAGSPPSDPSDFGRCYRLLQKFPHWRDKLQKVADTYSAWQPFVDAWETMTSLYEKELNNPDEKSNLFHYMRDLNCSKQRFIYEKAL